MKSDNKYGKSSHFDIKISLSCLRNTVCICCQIFMKLTHFIYIINSLKPNDFKQNLPISKGKVAILSWKFAFSVYAIKSTSLVRFL